MILLHHAVDAANPYSSNVLELNKDNFKEKVANNPHPVLVNMCRIGWGYCQKMQADYEKLATVSKDVTIAYWDTEQHMPRSVQAVLGDIQGTPTLRMIQPRKKSQTARETIRLEYQGDRSVRDMKDFIDSHMPNYTERVTFGIEDVNKYLGKADKFGLPKAIIFTSKPRTSTMLKWLSIEFRRRLLILEVPPTSKNEEVMKKYGIDDADSLPAMIVIGAGEDSKDIVTYDGDFKRHRLQSFLSQHALKEPVFKPIQSDDDNSAAAGEDTTTKESENGEKKEQVHTEF